MNRELLLVKTVLLMFCLFLVSCGGDGETESAPTKDDIIDSGPDGPVIPTSGHESATSYTGMSELWSDEFDGENLDEDNWNFQIGDNGWGNNELQNYKRENVSLKDGNLIIEAKVEGQGYTSSRINTTGKFTFKYGRVDVRAALPRGQGIWPAIWMLGENIETVGWPKCGEIDIMEMIGGSGRENTVHGTIHWDNAGSHANYGGNTILESGDFSDEFHVFSIVWDSEAITWYLDDKQYHVVDIIPSGLSEFHEDYHFLINMAVGGNWPGNPDNTTNFPQFFIVDYIRVFQED
ncbi:glycoside hydrolase family 16 protein [Urechidicola vernalis]|uniref:Glycoside hydrolase family 16 protein n=1 Tax=Urechidicola vernalis TaxID=3075600 RepID=A0ABU2Y6U1_9FLAO|nr:glycoside hydrolase family 16 protein [Urechidicola sp. P050]MDT0552763.1 glycoside hydrolase family 16 protein [Urechidicola sp. P050]